MKTDKEYYELENRIRGLAKEIEDLESGILLWRAYIYSSMIPMCSLALLMELFGWGTLDCNELKLYRGVTIIVLVFTIIDIVILICNKISHKRD